MSEYDCEPTRRRRGGRLRATTANVLLWATGFLAVSAALTGISSAAQAAPPDFLTRISAEAGMIGSGAAQLGNPRGIAANRENGHVYIAELSNARISEFTAWGQFVRAWGWGVADGAAEAQSCGPVEPEFEPTPGLCQQGSEGEGRGQLKIPGGIAVDGAGAVYVFDRDNRRVQKFSPDGEFILMFGGEVNETSGGDICPRPALPADSCKAGAAGTDPSHFANIIGNYIAYSESAEALLVGDTDRIQIFETDGSYREEIGFEGELEAFDGESVNALAVDGTGNIYFSLSGRGDAFKISAGGVPLDPGKPGSTKFKAEPPQAIAVDMEGTVNLVDNPPEVLVEDQVLQYDAAGNRLLPTAEEEEEKETFPYLPFNGPSINGIATNLCPGPDAESPGSLYIAVFQPGAYLDAYGSPPAECEPPPPLDPIIEEQYATAVGTEGAAVQATINPRFWKDTAYQVQYGTGKCSEGGCTQLAPASPATLSERVTNELLKTAKVQIGGLEPGATYHYRFVAESGFELEDTNGPVYSPEGAFKTFALPASPEPCANDDFRSGPGAGLPDCRAYELVSPLEKGNNDAGLLPPTATFWEVNQSAASGERFSYSSISAFAEPESTPFISQYLATRVAGEGWSNEAITPPLSTRVLDVNRSLNNEFKIFSPDLCEAWLRHNSAAPLTANAVPDYSNLYRRENCGVTPAYEALSLIEPSNRPANEYTLNPVGYSEDRALAFYLADDALTADAPVLPEIEFKELLLYVQRSGESEPRFVCRLPDGSPIATACAAGMAAAQPDGRGSAVQGAISEDGSRVFWTKYTSTLNGAPEGAAGQIYLRANPAEPESERLHGSARGTGDLAGPAAATCKLSKFTTTLTECAFASQFAVGQEIGGEHIKAGTTVTAVEAEFGRLKISEKPEESASGVAIAGIASTLVGNLTTASGEFAPEQEISGPGIAPGTQVLSCAPSCGEGATSLTLSTPATASGEAVALSATSECKQPARACTYPVSETVTTAKSEFWFAAADGSRAIFKVDEGPLAGNVYEYETATESSTLIGEGALGPMGASADATRLYYAASKVLAPGGIEGGRNLYTHEAGEGAGETMFVMGLAVKDVGGSEPRPAAINEVPIERSAVVSADGLHAAFGSSGAPPSGYDNLDARSGEPNEEVYLYDAGAEELRCASCNPTGARPVGEEVDFKAWAAARLPAQRTLLHPIQSLSQDGNRLFFESHEALVPRDTNETWDVYQWEAPAKGSCDEADPTYGEASGGCVDLISSGESQAESRLLDADADGSDVFIGTQSSLVDYDYGLNDVYDARIGGGLPGPPEPGPECEGEACQSPAPAPEAKTPASSTFQGEGNAASEPANPFARCRAAARRAKALSRRAKRLGRLSRRASAPPRARALRRRATRSAKQAKKKSQSARRCRARARRAARR